MKKRTAIILNLLKVFVILATMAFFISTLLELNSVKWLTADIRHEAKFEGNCLGAYFRAEEAGERLGVLELRFGLCFLLLGIVACTPWARVEKR